MFGWLFKKKTDREKLDLQYKKLKVKSYELSKTDRKASDALSAEAEEVSKMIEELDMLEAKTRNEASS
ncbi:MAG: hypothetical protein ACI86M_001589 [Saprospiraceae bacterium]|jgi:hypothetical protein